MMESEIHTPIPGKLPMFPRRTADNPLDRCKCHCTTAIPKTMVLIFSWLSLGLYCEILGPTLPTLMFQTGANYEQIGMALSIRSAGLLCGSLLGGWSADRWKRFRAFQMMIALFIAALTNIIIPWIRSVPCLATILYVAGCAHGFLTTNGNPLLTSIWDARSSAPLNLMHAGYGVGGAVAPALVAAFALPVSNHSSTMDVTSGFSNGTTLVLIDPIVPFNLVAGILVICAICFIPFSGFRCQDLSYRHLTHRCCVKNNNLNRPKKTCFQKIGQPCRGSTWTSCWIRIRARISSIRPHITHSKVLLVLCVFVIYFAIVGNERVFGKFMFTYAIYGPVHMTANGGYLLNLLYWICFAVARVITCLLALFIPTQLLLSLIVLGTLIVSVGLTLIPSTEPWFFAFSLLFSMFKSPLFPCTLAAINRSHQISGFVILVVNLGSASGASLMQYTAGSLIQTHGQTVFPYLVCASAVVVLLTAILLIVLLRFVGDRFVQQQKFELDDTSQTEPFRKLAINGDFGSDSPRII